jgi:hypothetical protein
MILLKDFINFLKTPTALLPIELGNAKMFLINVVYGGLILILIDISAGLIITPLKYFSLLPSLKPFHYTSYNILRLVLILPIVEELIFRLPLRISKINLIVFLSMVCFLLLYKFNILITVSSISIIVLFGIFFLKNNSNLLSFLNKLLFAYFPYFFFAQAIIFGVLHLFNYDLYLKHIFIFPFIILSQFITGLFLGFIRMRYTKGILLCILIHISVNSLYCLILA